MEGLAAEQVDSAEAEFPLKGLDLVMMNPPFTNNQQRNRQFGAETAKLMQKRELRLRNDLTQRDPDAASVINSNSIGTYFTPLADILLDRERGVLATILPATACTNASGLGERQFRARRFHIERIVTSHDPKRIAFSENTSIHECLLVARRWPGGKRPATEFVSLRRMPATPEDALAAADAIASGRETEWGRSVQWPSDRVEAGDWTPVQWFDCGLAEVVRGIEASPLLEPIEHRYTIGPAGRRARDAYRKCDDRTAGAVRLFWSISSQLRRTMEGRPEQWAYPKSGRESLAARYWQQRSSVLVAMKYDTIAGRLTSLWASEPSIGSGWVPVAVPDEREGKALVAWWNSTPARLMLLDRRTRKLTYPSWSLDQLRQIQVPKPGNPAWELLARAYDAVRDHELLPMAQAVDCVARSMIDEAAAWALGVSLERVVDWRRRLAREPTVSNAVANRR